MYTKGLASFLTAKQLKSNECINAFLKSENITDFTAKNHHRVNNFIDNNWTKFASFVDKGIKSGELKGIAFKMNTYWDEQRERTEKIREEFKNPNLSEEQQKIINIIKREGVSKIQSFLSKKGIKQLPKDNSYIAKQLQWLPLVNQIIEQGYLNQYIW